jgi:hypothetical protein
MYYFILNTKLQSYKATKLQSYKATKLQSYKATKRNKQNTIYCIIQKDLFIWILIFIEINVSIIKDKLNNNVLSHIIIPITLGYNVLITNSWSPIWLYN